MSWAEEKTLEKHIKNIDIRVVDRLAFVNGLVKRGSVLSTISDTNGGNDVTTKEILNIRGEGVVTSINAYIHAPTFSQGYSYNGRKSGLSEITIICDDVEIAHVGTKTETALIVDFMSDAKKEAILRCDISNEFQSFKTTYPLNATFGTTLVLNDYIKFYKSLKVIATQQGSYGYFEHWNIAGSSWTAINAYGSVSYSLFDSKDGGGHNITKSSRTLRKERRNAA